MPPNNEYSCFTLDSQQVVTCGLCMAMCMLCECEIDGKVCIAVTLCVVKTECC